MLDLEDSYIMKLSTSALRKALFGTPDRTSVYLVQAWTTDDLGEPKLWRSIPAYTRAGANRVKQGKKLISGISPKREVWIVELRVQELDTNIARMGTD